LLRTFQRAATHAPAYRTLLEEHGVQAARVTDFSAFSRLCPVLSKSTTFDRFSIDQLSIDGRLGDLAEVLTSSGRGGRFSFGVSTREEAAATIDFLDDAFDAAFRIKSRSTLAINCLPMGVGFSSRYMTVATTSVREDMALALVKTFGRHYDQMLLVGDPMFMKRLVDHAREMAVDWTRYRVHAILGEEVFGERCRGYLAGGLGVDLERPGHGLVLSSFGVGELGLHLGYETPTTVAIRRAALADPDFASELFGSTAEEGGSLPMLFAFDPLRVWIEIMNADACGYGLMTISMLDHNRTIPLLRYQTGDLGTVLGGEHVAEVVARYRVHLDDEIPPALFGLRGRDSEALPNGSYVSVYKDALYADHRAAEHLTGALRLTFEGARCTMHVQLVPSASVDPSVQQRIAEGVPPDARPERVVLWPYHEFPFGMTLDYERKFSHYVPGELAPPALAAAVW
jgi:phenylacetate-CoA ligase